jgi:hypothetical protein
MKLNVDVVSGISPIPLATSRKRAHRPRRHASQVALPMKRLRRRLAPTKSWGESMIRHGDEIDPQRRPASPVAAAGPIAAALWALADHGPRSHPAGMFVVSEADATAIRAAFEQRGEFAAAVELRRLFPGVADMTEARECARAIAAWKPLPVKPGPVRLPSKGR